MYYICIFIAGDEQQLTKWSKQFIVDTHFIFMFCYVLLIFYFHSLYSHVSVWLYCSSFPYHFSYRHYSVCCSHVAVPQIYWMHQFVNVVDAYLHFADEDHDLVTHGGAGQSSHGGLCPNHYIVIEVILSPVFVKLFYVSLQTLLFGTSSSMQHCKQFM